jgi:hypothetical protein
MALIGEFGKPKCDSTLAQKPTVILESKNGATPHTGNVTAAALLCYRFAHIHNAIAADASLIKSGDVVIS